MTQLQGWHSSCGYTMTWLNYKADIQVVVTQWYTMTWLNYKADVQVVVKLRSRRCWKTAEKFLRRCCSFSKVGIIRGLVLNPRRTPHSRMFLVWVSVNVSWVVFSISVIYIVIFCVIYMQLDTFVLLTVPIVVWTTNSVLWQVWFSDRKSIWPFGRSPWVSRSMERDFSVSRLAWRFIIGSSLIGDIFSYCV